MWCADEDHLGHYTDSVACATGHVRVNVNMWCTDEDHLGHYTDSVACATDHV